jgi:dihydropteroate synthase
VSDAATRGALRLRGRALPWGHRTYLMGIVNVAPDSFSGDGAPDPAAAILRAAAQRDAGSDLLDIGAESTRPGYQPIDERTECERLLPVVEGFRRGDDRTIVSIDTFKPGVYRRAHAAGGDVLNSIWGANGALIEVCVETRSPIVVMHNKAVAIYERDVVDEVLAALAAAAERCVRAGIPAEHVILDPGIGFGKTPEHNLMLLAALDRLVALGFPTLLGTSRKSTLGRLTGRPVAERAFGTAATVALAAAAGIDIVRVHDVAEQRDVVNVADAVVRGWRPPGWTDALR